MFRLRRPYSRTFWQRLGVAMTGHPVNDEGSAQEPSVIYEGDPQILAGDVFKMWWMGGWVTPHLNYAESVDGINFTNLVANPVIVDIMHTFVTKFGAVYYAYGVPVAAINQIDLYTSNDGIAWVLDTASVLPPGAGGSWDDFAMGNCFVWQEGVNDWRMIYEAHADALDPWALGYAISVDGRVWVKNGGNPVYNPVGSVGGPEIYQSLAGVYWMWAHYSDTGFLPTDVERLYSNDLINWTLDRMTFFRHTEDEGVRQVLGQIADVSLGEVGGQTYMWYSASQDGTVPGTGVIKVAITPFTLERIITMIEDT